MNAQRYHYILARMRRQAQRVLHKLRSQKIVHFLHIGKTGGSAIKVFFFVRDPIKRFVSGFHSRYRQGQPRYLVPWSPQEKIIFEHFESPNALARALSSEDADERALAETAMRSIRHVKSSYWDWFLSADYFRSRRQDILFIGHQDRLKEDFTRLKEMLGLPAEVALPEDDLRAHRNPGGVDKTLDDTAVANLRAWYQKDYEFLALCEALMPAQREATR